MTFVALLAAATIVDVHVDTVPSHVLNVVRPLHAIGTSIDSDPKGKIGLLYSPHRVDQMLEAGFGSLSVRLYTELSIQDWHWNPAGTFSQGDRGYWTSSAAPSAEIIDSYGYALPHRGNTRDQGEDNGYSRIDDGDPATYWKSDPYLAQRYTGDPDSEHPQWAVVDLDLARAVDGIRVSWANPYATHFRVQYWQGVNGRQMPGGTYLQPGGTVTGYDTVDAIIDQSHGSWRDFPQGVIAHGRGGAPLIRLAKEPIQTHWVRVLMDASSNTCDSHGGADPRDCVGYAIRDIAIGLVDSAGRLHDDVRHTPCGGNPLDAASSCAPHQSTIYVSSEDPWHSAQDVTKNDQDQPGLDIVARSGIAHGLPVMYPVPLFYSTPQNAANMIRYLEARKYPIAYVEMGEEVDGQYATPEDYAALYVEFADAIHGVDPRVKLGGPVFEGVNIDTPIWPDANGDTRWFHRFLAYLRSHHRLGDLAFMSYEHYPFAGCDQDGRLYEDLVQEPALVKSIVEMWRADGLPRNIPTFMTEDNFANDGGPVPKQLEGALWMADWIASSLGDGVTGVNYYQMEAEPTGFKRACDRAGGYGVFIVDDQYRILAKSSQFWAARMLTHEWFAPGDTAQRIFPSSVSADSRDLSSYAVKRPDGSWSIMFVNKSSGPIDVRLGFGSGGARFKGTVDVVMFGPAQYRWEGRAPTELPSPNTGPQITTAHGLVYEIPADSITILRGRI